MVFLFSREVYDILRIEPMLPEFHPHVMDKPVPRSAGCLQILLLEVNFNFSVILIRLTNFLINVIIYN